MQHFFKFKAFRTIIVLLASLIITVTASTACASNRENEEKEETPTQEEQQQEEQKEQEEEIAEETGDFVHEILATGEAGDNDYPAPPPGKSAKLPREYPGAPPLIPHSTKGFVIDKDSNTCISCHQIGLSFGEGHTATKIPESHYTDVVTGETFTYVVETRYICNLCHLPQSGEDALVAND